MPFLDERGVQTLWDNTKSWFAKWIDVASSDNTVTVSLKSGWNPETDENVEVLDSANIPVATTTSAGVMSKEDKSKLDGVAVGATANIGTITEVKTTSPLAGSATSGSVTVSHSASGVSTGSYGPAAGQGDLEPNFGDTINVPGYTVNATGHITVARERSVKIPDSTATASADGLMSAEDKAKLNGVAEGATANTGTIEGITSTGPIVGSGTSGTVALSHADSGVAADTYGDTATTALTPAFGDTINVPGIAVNATGHVTGAGSHTVKLPENVATVDVKGLMSSDDKAKLNGIEVGATKTTIDAALSGTSTNPPQNKIVKEALDLKAPLASPALTGTPTAPTAADGTSTTQIATTEFVNNAFRVNDALVFKGTIGTNGTVTALPATHYQGWTYKVVTAATYAGQPCEIGDMIICITDGTVAADSDWTVVQSNIDGAVIGPASSTNNNIAAFDGTSGKLLKDGGISTSDIVTLTGTQSLTNKTIDTIGFSSTESQDIDENVSVTITVEHEVDDAPYGFAVVDDVNTLSIEGLNSSAGLQLLDADKTDEGGTVYLVDGSLSIDSTGQTVDNDTTLATHQNVIDYVGSSLSSNGSTYYGTCSTGDSSAEKAVTCPGYTLKTGNIIAILFTAGSLSASPTLNINSTGAKSIKFSNTTINTDLPCQWQARELLYFIYDGTYYHYLGRTAASGSMGFGNTWLGNCTSTENNPGKSVSDIHEMPLIPGQLVSIKFSNGNTADSINIATHSRNIPIYYKGALTSASNKLTWNSNDILTFIVDTVNNNPVFRFVCKSSGGSDGGVIEVIPALETEIAAQLPSGSTGEYGLIYDTTDGEINIESIEALEPIPVESVLDPTSSNIPTSQAVANYLHGGNFERTLIIKNSNLNLQTPPSSDFAQSAIKLTDVNDTVLGSLVYNYQTNGYRGVTIATPNGASSGNLYNTLGLFSDGSGSSVVYISHPQSWRDALEINSISNATIDTICV